MVSYISVIAALIVTLIASITDVRSFRVPNRLTFFALAAGLLFHATSSGLYGIYGSFVGAVTGFVLLVGIYMMGGMGAGDVKLLAAVGAWLGPADTWRVFLASAIASGVYAAVVMTFRTLKPAIAAPGHDDMPLTIAEGVARPDRWRNYIPFAVMMAVGVAVVEGYYLAASPL